MVSNRKKILSNRCLVHPKRMDFRRAVKTKSLVTTAHSEYTIKIKEEMDEDTSQAIEETMKTIKQEVDDDDDDVGVAETDVGLSPTQLTIYGPDPHSDNEDPCDKYAIEIKAEPQLDISDVLHNELATDDEPSQKYSCSHCDFEIDVKYYLDIHNEMMHSLEKDCESTEVPDDLACSHCDHRANNKWSLKRHMLAKHVDGEKRYACYICDFSTTNLLVLQSHRECHRRDKSYSCPHCKTFTSSHLAAIRKHERKHLSEMSNHKLIFCADCDYRTYFKYCLKMHSKVHLIEKPPEPVHPCKLCDFQTKRLRVLRVHHQRIHLNEEPFICPICKHAYASNGSLSRHLKTHSKEEHSIQCTECDYKTLQYSSMKGHMLTHSKPPTTYRCAHCDFSTNRKASIVIHVKIHRSPNACSRCDFKTHLRTAFKRHHCLSKKTKKSHRRRSIASENNGCESSELIAYQ